MRLYHLLSIALVVFLNGCSYVYKPSYTLGTKIEPDNFFSEKATRSQIIQRYGNIDVPCIDSNNICYLYADIHRMDLKECEIVEFVLDRNQELEHIVFYRKKD